MASREYLSGRKKWYRPQAMIWSDKRFVLHNGGFVPDEYEEGVDFIVITDHNRDAIELTPQRIEARSRMINGTSRSYFTADKVKLSTSWSMLPSRIATMPVAFDEVSGARITGGEAYVADDASSANDIKDWYDTHPGDFYVYLSYDLGSETDSMDKYIVELRMFFESASFSIQKRGIVDMWNINISLDEV